MSILDDLKFKNLNIKGVQTDDEMMVVPIVGVDRGEVAEPKHLEFKGTSNYGSMVFLNKDPQKKPAIVPANLLVRGRAAQDHAMAGSGIITTKQKTFQNACCVEETQGGFLSQNVEKDILPVELRKKFLSNELRRRRDYSKLWPSIKEWLMGLKVRGRNAHIRYFYDSDVYKEKLEEFAASFEPVPNQIGAVILFSGIPVGIEIMPTQEHWNHYWKYLIRGCYGAEMIRLKELGKLQPSALVLPDIPDNTTIEDAERILEEFEIHVRDSIIPLIENIALKSTQNLTQDGSITSSLVKTTTGGGGDVITQGSEPIYLSLVL